MGNKNKVKDIASVGPTLRRLRKKQKRSAVWVADQMGIRPESLSKIENGHTVPGIDTILSFCKVLNLTMVLLNGDDQ